MYHRVGGFGPLEPARPLRFFGWLGWTGPNVFFWGVGPGLAGVFVGGPTLEKASVGFLP